MRILISGGARFPGINITNYLLNNLSEGEIFVLDDKMYRERVVALSSPQMGLSFWEGDLENVALMRNLLHNVDAVINFFSDKPFEEYSLGIRNLFEQAKDSKVQRIIHISSYKVYGDISKSPVNEDYCTKPINLEGVALAYGEKFAHYMSASYDLPIVILRVFKVYGPHQPLTEVIPLFITNALEDRPLPLWEKGERLEDFLHIDDVASAITKILSSDFSSLKGEIINLGSGRSIPLKKVAAMILQQLDKKQNLVQFEESEGRNSQVLISSIVKAKVLLNWSPRIGIEEGLKRTIDWYLSNQTLWNKQQD